MRAQIDAACERGDWLEWAIDFVFSPSCTALDPHEVISTSALEARADAIIERIERKAAFKLDSETRENIREDVRRIWHRGTPQKE